MFFLPEQIKRYVSANRERLFELRLRKDKPVIASINGIKQQITYKDSPLTVTEEEINNIVYSACENSIYLYNDCIKNGYVTTADGIRIGLCGRCVYNDEKLLTITHFSSICIRFPHQVIGCSAKIYELIDEVDRVKSTLILSPPGVGKTTAIRDLARMISFNNRLNVLIVDEKYEIYSNKYDLGETCDVICGCNKNFGFFNGIKNISPDLIIVDELTDSHDVAGVEFARLSGVSVIATAHSANFDDALKKDYLERLFAKNCFDICVALKKGRLGFEICEVVSCNDKSCLGL